MAHIPNLARRGGGAGEWVGGVAVDPKGVGAVFPCGLDPLPTVAASKPNQNGGLQLHTLDEPRSVCDVSDPQLESSPRSFTTAEFGESTDVHGRDTEEDMETGRDNIPLEDCSRSQSNDHLTESTVFSLSQSESLWTTESARSAWEIYQYPILLLATGGAVFICGVVLSGLYFAKISKMVTNILGPALLSIGLMVLVIGLVLVPITKENQKPPMKRRVSYYRPPQFNL